MSAIRARVLTIGFLVAGATSAESKADRQVTEMWSNARGEVLWVFVGEQESIVEQRLDFGPDVVFMDVHYVATYRPLQVIEGKVGDAPVEFSVYDHGGYPRFAFERTALLFVFANKTPVLAKYQGYAVDRTTDGRWAHCGDPYGSREDLPQDVRHVVPLRFRDDVVFDDVSRWSAKRIAETYPAGAYEIIDGKVHCLRGVYAEDLARQIAVDLRIESAWEAREGDTAPSQRAQPK